MMNLRAQWRIWAYIAILSMIWLICFSYYRTARSNYHSAHDDLQVASRLAHEIVELRKEPAAIRAQALEQLDLVRRIETTAKQCQITDKSLDRIAPDAPHRLAGTQYEERPVQILLRQVTMSQLLPFLYHLSSGAEGLTVKSCRISAPRGEESGDTWRAEISVAYLIYSPNETASVR